MMLSVQSKQSHHLVSNMAFIPNKSFNDLYIENKSKFYSFLIPINSKEDYKQILLDLKQEYKGARHYCYALKVGGFAKYDDDGEPKGTAGQPLYWLLNTKDIDNALIVVIRYFGGVKLGAGKLYRAYLKSGALVVEKFLKG